MNFYKNKKWTAKHNTILRRDEYECQECKRYGKSVKASHVHHIIPLEWCLIFNQLMAWASINLISLCKHCHDKMHDRTNNRLTELGLKLVIRKLKDYGEDWVEKYGKAS